MSVDLPNKKTDTREKPDLQLENKDQTQNQEKIKEEVPASQIALVGDSIGEGISSAIKKKFSQEHGVLATTSARLEEGTKYKPVAKQLGEIDPKKTPYLVIQGGTNDIVHSEPFEIANSLVRLYEKAKSMGFKKIIVVTIPPHTDPDYKTKVNSVNAQLRIFAQQGKIELFDLNSEYTEIDPNSENISKGGVHPTNKGYEIMADLLVKEMQGKSEKRTAYSAEMAEELRNGETQTVNANSGEAQVGEMQQPEQINATTNEHKSAESIALQNKLNEEIAALTAEQKQKDEQALSGAEIEDIRFNTALLNGNEDNVREEMKHRLAQYTEKQGDGGLRINYSKFNSNGRDHEMNIGLGDIMPPEYKRVLIVKSGGEYKLAKRGITNTSRESNRIGYVDENTGSYLATFTGDTIYVLDPAITDQKELAELLAKEKETRKTGRGSFAVPKEPSAEPNTEPSEGNSSGNDYNSTGSGSAESGSTEQNEQSDKNKPTQSQEQSSELKENIDLKDRAIKGLDKNIAGKKFWDYNNVKIKITKDGKTIFWEYNPSVSEGTNIYNYSKAVCEAHGIGNMISTVWAIAENESRFNPFNTHTESTATGLGQAMEETWASFIPRAKKSQDPLIKSMLVGAYGKGVEYEKRGQKGAKQTIVIDLSTNKYPPNADYKNYSRCNPYLNIYSTIMGIIKNKESYEKNSNKTGITDFNSLKMEDQLRLLYLSHHDGAAGGPGVLAFMKYISENLGVDLSNREQVLRFIASDSPESQRALQLMPTSTRNREYGRAKSRDPDERDACLRSWYQTCQNVVKSATGNKNYKDFSIPKMRDTRAIASATQQEQPTNQSNTAPESTPPRNLTAREKQEAARIRSMPKPNFDYQAVYVLGCGVPEQNNLRAVIGAELAAKNNAKFMTSGGATSKFRAKGTTEGEAALKYIAAQDEYQKIFTEKNLETAIENKSGNTAENFENLVKYAKNKGLKKILIVTTETGNGARAGHGAEGARKLKRLYPEVEVSFYTPENPNIDRNVA